ncbi:MAG: hypothetical protein WAM60_03650 [Candidatus Promineifilaceae bacterium]
MSHKQNNLIWGAMLIILGSVFLIQSLGLIPEFSALVWTAFLSVICLFLVAAYLFSGIKNWGWLFPIFITGGLALAAGLSLTTINSLWLGAIFMASISTPFWIVFLLNPKENWWALIPGWATAVLTLVILVSDWWAGETIGALVMWSIALPFLVVYLRNRTYWWALIPGFIMVGMGIVVLLASQSPETFIGVFVLLMIAFPFFAVFFFTKGNWWAVIPAGIMTTLALIVPFASQIEGETTETRLVAAFMFLGFSLPFGYLWWQRDRIPTSWAKYPTAGFVAAAAFTLALGTVIENGWPFILIIIGAWLLYDNMHQPKLKS